MLELKKGITLKDLVQYKADLEKKSAEDGSTLPDEVQELGEVADLLLRGKVDQAARFRAGLEAGIVAAKAQAAYLQEMYERTEDLMKEAAVAAGGKLHGDSWDIRVQNNSRASTIIDDAALVPTGFMKVSFTESFAYDEEMIQFWIGAKLGRVVEFRKDLTEAEKGANVFYRLELTKEERGVAEKLFSLEHSKSAIETALKVDPKAVPGARLEKGTHLRVTPGKAKPKLVEAQ